MNTSFCEFYTNLTEYDIVVDLRLFVFVIVYSMFLFLNNRIDLPYLFIMHRFHTTIISSIIFFSETYLRYL